MGVSEWQTYCPNCNRVVLGRKKTPNHILHFLVTFLTCGFWVIPWVIFALSSSSEPYRCTSCGTAGRNS